MLSKPFDLGNNFEWQHIHIPFIRCTLSELQFSWRSLIFNLIQQHVSLVSQKVIISECWGQMLILREKNNQKTIFGTNK